MPNPLKGASFAEVMAKIVDEERFKRWLATKPGNPIQAAQGDLFEPQGVSPLAALREHWLGLPRRNSTWLGNIPNAYYQPEAPLKGLALRSSPDVEDWEGFARQERFTLPHFDLSGGSQALPRLLHNRSYTSPVALKPSMMVSGVPQPRRPLLVTDREVNRPDDRFWDKVMSRNSMEKLARQQHGGGFRGLGLARNAMLSDLGYDALIYPNKFEGLSGSRAKTVPWVMQDPAQGYPFAPLSRTPLGVREELARRYFAGEPVIANPSMALLDRGALLDVAEHRRAGGRV